MSPLQIYAQEIETAQKFKNETVKAELLLMLSGEAHRYLSEMGKYEANRMLGE